MRKINGAAETDLITIVRKYFDAIENGEPGESLQFFAPDVVQEEFPNRLIPDGATRDLAALKEARAPRWPDRGVRRYFE